MGGGDSVRFRKLLMRLWISEFPRAGLEAGSAIVAELLTGGEGYCCGGEDLLLFLGISIDLPLEYPCSAGRGSKSPRLSVEYENLPPSPPWNDERLLSLPLLFTLPPDLVKASLNLPFKDEMLDRLLWCLPEPLRRSFHDPPAPPPSLL